MINWFRTKKKSSKAANAKSPTNRIRMAKNHRMVLNKEDLIPKDNFLDQLGWWVVFERYFKMRYASIKKIDRMVKESSNELMVFKRQIIKR